MNQSTNNIQCPKCGHVMNVNEAFEAKLRKQLEKEFEGKKSVLTIELQKKISKQINDERELQIQTYQRELIEKANQLKSHLKLRADYDKLSVEFGLLKDKLESEFQNQLSKRVSEFQAKTKDELKKSFDFKLEEKNLLINQLQNEIQNAQRRIDKSSQQHQGESAEIVLEKTLKKVFPTDIIVEYKKGEKGADIRLEVLNAQHEIAGTIIFESKRTKSFSAVWIEKLKNEMRLKKANAAILVTDVLPKNWEHAGQLEGIWIASFSEWLILVKVIRESILLLDNVNSMQVNRGTKMEAIHQYLSGPDFRNTVEEVISSFNRLKSDLDKEKIQLSGFWKSREILLDRVLQSTSGMYHSVKAILGSKVPEIKLLANPDNEGGEIL